MSSSDVHAESYLMVPGAGIEPARLAAGDFESERDSLCLGTYGVAERRFK